MVTTAHHCQEHLGLIIRGLASLIEVFELQWT